MMGEPFTMEEVNLICIFDTGSRDKLIAEIKTAMLDFEEPEIAEIAEAVIVKLEKMSDETFAALTFYPEYEDYEEEE